MAFKEFNVAGIGNVTVYKRRGARSLRLSIGASGKVRVTIPAWAAYHEGLKFALNKQSWIAGQRPPKQLIHEGQLIGKAHHIHFEAVFDIPKATTRLRGTEIIINYDAADDFDNPTVQAAALRGCIRALRAQAEQLLPGRLRLLAEQHGFTYNSVTIKQLKGRWGSCDQQKNIVLNLFLMQLPWHCIDYVLLHELTHTTVLKHGPEFWEAMEQVLPDVQAVRREIHSHQPTVAIESMP